MVNKRRCNEFICASLSLVIILLSEYYFVPIRKIKLCCFTSASVDAMLWFATIVTSEWLIESQPLSFYFFNVSSNWLHQIDTKMNSITLDSTRATERDRSLKMLNKTVL